MEKKHILVSYPEQNYRTELKGNDTMTVLNGGTVVSTHINGGKLEVEQDGLAIATDISEGSCIVKPGGSAFGFEMSGGVCDINPGGSAQDFILERGELEVGLNGIADDFYICGGGTLAVCSGGTATKGYVCRGVHVRIDLEQGTCVEFTSRRRKYKMGGGAVSGVTVGSGGRFIVSSGCTALEIETKPGALLTIRRGAVVTCVGVPPTARKRKKG